MQLHATELQRNINYKTPSSAFVLDNERQCDTIVKYDGMNDATDESIHRMVPRTDQKLYSQAANKKTSYYGSKMQPLSFQPPSWIRAYLFSSTVVTEAGTRKWPISVRNMVYLIY